MKIPENISPDFAAYIKALQSENSKLQNENSELQNENSELKTKVEKQELQISNLTEMLVNSRKKMFGKSSEKSKYFNDAQMSLFDEAEVCADESAPEPDKETFITAHKRRSGTRILLIQPKEKPFSDHKRKAVEFISKQLNLYFYSKLKPNRIHYEGSNYLCDRLSLHSLKLGIMMLGNRDFKDITGFDGFKTMCDSFDRT